LAYLIPDFQNPAGHLMTEVQREAYAGHLRRAGTVAVVDEAHQALALDGQAMPPPFAAYAPDTITLGSASKAFWGGMRLGWIRAPEHRMAELIRARVTIDLGASVLEQLVLTRLLADAASILAAHRERLRDQRQALAEAVTEQLPQWSFQLPTGGLALWCRLPSASAGALAAAAEALGVIVAPGPVFAVEGGLDRFVRIPWTRPAEELHEAVLRLSRAWATVAGRSVEIDTPRPRVVVA
jgi:DNA-binding transcriptional MocR family regulator